MQVDKKPIEIYAETDKFILKKDQCIVELNKTTNENEFLEKYYSNITPFYCYGIVGSLQADKQRYLVYIDEVIKKGEYFGANIYLITKFNYIPYESDVIAPEDYKNITMINDFLGRNCLFFSDRVDLTMSFKYLNDLIDKKLEKKWTNIFSLSNMNFCWNSFLANVFIRDKSDSLDQFIFPIINGYFGTCSGEEYSGDLVLALIARKDIRRSGMRFLIRGADKDGNVANFVEIEEILISKHSTNTIINSYIEIRGSIPLIWTQEPNMTRNPKVEIYSNPEENYKAFSAHILELINKYDSVHCINLIDKKKDQLKIGKEYEKLCNEFKTKQPKEGRNLEYSWFDFHHECKKMRYDNIKKLFLQESVSNHLEDSKYTNIQIDQKKYQDMLKDKQTKILDYFIKSEFLKFIEKQKVVFRSNCMDSLDRCNVVQSVFARYFLHLMLKDLNFSDVTPSKENISIEFRGNFENKFKNLWADIGDYLAFAYSGTGAMKGDFVRTGKRTLMGNFRDLFLTMKRLYINNLMDGYNQDCHDYFLGNLNPKKEVIRPHSLTKINTIFIIASMIAFQLTRMITPSGFSILKTFLKFPIFLIFTAIIAMAIIYPLKKQLIDLHTNHDKYKKK